MHYIFSSGNKFKKIIDLPYSNVFIRKIYQQKDSTFLLGTAYGLLTLKNPNLKIIKQRTIMETIYLHFIKMINWEF